MIKEARNKSTWPRHRLCGMGCKAYGKSDRTGEWLFPSQATQHSRPPAKPFPIRVSIKMGVCIVARLGFAPQIRPASCTSQSTHFHRKLSSWRLIPCFLKLFSAKIVALITLCSAFYAHGEIYKTVDAEGRVTYSNVKIKGAQKLNLEPGDSSFGTQNDSAKRTSLPKSESPGNFPKVDPNTQKQRDNSRKDVLRNELDGEKAALEAAKQAYAEGESNPEVYKGADGKTLRNYAKFEEKMKKLQEEIDVHQRNVDLLQKELNTTN